MVRDTGAQALADYRAGNYRAALDKLERAYSLLKVPTLALWSARSMAKLGRLVDASERYLQATRLPVSEGDTEVQKQAIATARQERAQLLPRIPKLTILVMPGLPQDGLVTIDGRAVPPATLGLARPVDPGRHLVVVGCYGQNYQQQAVLAEGQTQKLVFNVGNAPPLALVAPPSPMPPAKQVASAPAPAEDATADHGTDQAPPSISQQQLVGWGALGLGGAGLVVGTVGGVITSSKKSSLDSSGDCSGTGCTESQYDAVDSYNRWRTISTVGFVLGGVATTAGVVLLLTAPEQEDTNRVALTLGPGHVDLAGRF